MVSPLEMFLKWEKETPDALMLRQPFKGKWTTWTYKEAGYEIRRLAAGIKTLRLPYRSRIALLSKNCAHWIMADLAIIMTGNVSVPLYPTLTPSTISQTLDHSGASAIIIGKLDNYSLQKEGIPANVRKIGISTYGIIEDISWEDLVKNNEPLTEFELWSGNEILTIIYTSGTTGVPKGVMHTTGTFHAAVSVSFKDLKLPLHPQLFSYLPLSHIAERAGIEMYGLYSGAVFSFAESLDTFARDVMQVQPTIFFAVPRIWSKFQEKILENIPQSRLNLLLSIPVVSTILKKSIRKKLGLSRTTHVYSGAAPISVDLLKWFEKLGVIIFQAIGMTEDCVNSHFNRHSANKFGSVGKALSGVVTRVSAEGELRLKNPGMMKGYFNETELTLAAFDEDGFFKTGDLVEYDSEGFLFVTGRLKDQFKTDKGKYISPGPIETALLANTDIEQVCVVGMGLPQPIAMIILSPGGKKKNNDALDDGLRDTLSKVNVTLQKHERLEKLIIMNYDWSIENGMITPTLKVKRREVEKINSSNYSRWYGLKEDIIRN